MSAGGPKPEGAAPGPEIVQRNGEIDLLGRSLTLAEVRLLRVYRTVLELLAEDLPPSTEANLREAAAALWNAVTDLALVDERPDL